MIAFDPAIAQAPRWKLSRFLNTALSIAKPTASGSVMVFSTTESGGVGSIPYASRLYSEPPEIFLIL